MLQINHNFYHSNTEKEQAYLTTGCDGFSAIYLNSNYVKSVTSPHPFSEGKLVKLP